MTEFRTAALARDLRLAGATIPAGTVAEIRMVYLGRRDMPLVVIVVAGHRVSVDPSFLPSGALRGMTVSAVSR